MAISANFKDFLRSLINQPSLIRARELEQVLVAAGYKKKVFGRLNQKSSIEAVSESDRGVTERIANSFDASLTAARQLAGVDSDPSLRPRVDRRKPARYFLLFHRLTAAAQSAARR